MKQMEQIRNIEQQVESLKNNQKHVIEALENLNQRFSSIENGIEQLKDIKDIIDSQSVIDEQIVKNSDDIKKLLKWKNSNLEAIEQLDHKSKIVEDREREIIKKLNILKLTMI